MPLEVGKRCVDFLLENARSADEISLQGRKRKIAVTFWGGEPLIEWDTLKKIVLYGEKLRDEIPIEFNGTTNGSLFTVEKLGFLKDHMIGFMVSFDGTRESHDVHRRFLDGRGSHDIVARNISAALKVFPGLRVRMSPFAEGIDRFSGDVKYLVDLGIKNVMFSPVYESGWTGERWEKFRTECLIAADLVLDYRKKGEVIHIEHYKTYARGDDSKWPCGAGRFYVGFDVDGAMFPCHRFNKFTDHRPWSQKELCIGHVDHGITNPVFRERFIQFKPTGCDECEYDKITPCNGGCYAVNYDLTGNIAKAPDNLCEYTRMQSGVSRNFREKYGPNGFPEAREDPIAKSTPAGIMQVIVQMGDKISKIENLLEGRENVLES
jgi:uncharacterized protein